MSRSSSVEIKSQATRTTSTSSTKDSQVPVYDNKEDALASLGSAVRLLTVAKWLEQVRRAPLRMVGTIGMISLGHYLARPGTKLVDNFLCDHVKPRCTHVSQLDEWLAPAQRMLIGADILAVSMFWIFAIAYAILDWILKNKKWGAAVLARFKLHSAMEEPRFWAMCPQVIFNQNLSTFLCHVSCHIWPVIDMDTPPRFGVLSTIGWIGIFTLIADVEFFIMHKLMHSNRNFYTLTHRKHHTTLGTSAISAHYMTFFDFFFEATVPLVLPSLICGITMNCAWAFGTIGTWNSCVVHSGWDFGCLPDPHDHWWHHRRNDVNFGLAFSDGLAGCKLNDRAPFLVDKKVSSWRGVHREGAAIWQTLFSDQASNSHPQKTE